MHAAPILRVAETDDEAFALEAIHCERHGAGGHAHLSREVGQGDRIDRVEVIEDARLVTAEHPLRLRVPDVARVAGEVDPRVQSHDLPGRFNHSGIDGLHARQSK